MDNRACPQCGFGNPAHLHFCRSCGVRLENPAPPEFSEPIRPEPTEEASRDVEVEPSPAPVRLPRPRSSLFLFLLAGLVVAGLGIAAWVYLGGKARDSLEQVTAEKNEAKLQLAHTQELTAEKDSLLSELLETTTLITELSQAVATTESGRNAPIEPAAAEGGRRLTAREARALLLPKIDSLRMRLKASESRLGASLDRVKQMAGVEATLRDQIADYQRTVESVRKLVAAQQIQLNTLGTEVLALRAENKRLLETQSQLVAVQTVIQDSIAKLREIENTVYWVAGSKSELLSLGVAVEEGKGKVLVFGKGKSLQPARELRAADFIPIDKSQTLTIALPLPSVRYRILSRQSLAGLQNGLDKDGHVRGTVQISDPAVFWGPSRYLILLAEK
jgi:hypothetical protein